jgi:hypothetical protein
MQEQKWRLEIINPHSAGIDLGSKEHWIAIAQGLSETLFLERMG